MAARRLPDPDPPRSKSLSDLLRASLLAAGRRDATRLELDDDRSVADRLRLRFPLEEAPRLDPTPPPPESPLDAVIREGTRPAARDALRPVPREAPVRPSAGPSGNTVAPHTAVDRNAAAVALERLAFQQPSEGAGMLERGLNTASFGLARPVGGAINSLIASKVSGIPASDISASRTNRTNTFADRRPDAIQKADIWAGVLGAGAEEAVARGVVGAVGRSMRRSVADEFGSVGRVVPTDHPGRFLHGTKARNIKTLTGERPTPQGRGPNPLSWHGDSNEFGAELFLSDPENPWQALMFSDGRGDALAEISLRPGSKIFDVREDMARAPRIALDGEDSVLRFLRRPDFMDDMVEWRRSRISDGYKARNPTWFDDVAAELEPGGPKFSVDAWRENLLPYARSRGYDAVQLSDETLLANRDAIHSVRNVSPSERSAIKGRAPAGGFGRRGTLGDGGGAAPMLGAMTGSIGGAAAGATQGDTPGERVRNALLGGVVGGVGGAVLGRGAERLGEGRLSRALGTVDDALPVRGDLGHLGRKSLLSNQADDWATAARPSVTEAPKPSAAGYLDDLGAGRIGEATEREAITPAMQRAVADESSVARITRMAAEGQLQRPRVRLAEMERFGREIGLDGFHARKAAGMTSAEMAERVRVLSEYPRLADDLERQLADPNLVGEARRVAAERLRQVEDQLKESVGRVVVGGGDAARSMAYLRWRGKDLNSEQFWLTQAARSSQKAGGDPRQLPDEVRTKVRQIINEGRAKAARTGKGVSGLDDPARVNLNKKVRPDDIGAGSTQIERMSDEGFGAEGIIPRDANKLGIERADELDLSDVKGSGKSAGNPETYAVKSAERDARRELDLQRKGEPNKVSLDPKVKPDPLDLDARPEGPTLAGGKGVDPLEGVTGGGKTGFREIKPETARAGTERLTREATAGEDAIRQQVMDAQGVPRPVRPDTEKQPSAFEKAVDALPEETQRKLALYIRSLHKSYFGEKVIDQWRANLLSWFQTTALNLGSNATKATVESLVEQPLAALYDAAYVGARRGLGKAAERSATWRPSHVLRGLEAGHDAAKQASGYNTFKATYDELRAAGKGRLAAGGKAAKAAVGEIATPHGDLSILDAMERPDVVYGPGKVGRILEMNRNLIFGALGKQDVPFRAAARARVHMELSELRAMREGLQPGTEQFAKRIADLTSLEGAEASDLILALAKQADEEAAGSVFMQKNKVSEGISRFKAMSNSPDLGSRAVGYTTNLVMPFSQVPTNLVSATTASTPLGLARPFLKADQLAEVTKATGLNMRQRVAVQSAAKVSVGLAFMQVGAMLEDAGRMSGALPFAKAEQGLFRQENKQSGAVKLGTDAARWASLIALGPYGILMAMGAQMRRALNDAEGQGGVERLAAGLGGAAQGLGETLLETPMLQGLDEINRGVKGQGNVIANKVGSFVPSWMGGIARGLDPVQDRDVAENFLGPAMARIPGVRQMLPERPTPLGDTNFKLSVGTPERLGREAFDLQRARPARQDVATEEAARLGVPLSDLPRQTALKAQYRADGSLRPERAKETLAAYRARRDWVNPRVRLELDQYLNSAAYHALGGNPDRQRDAYAGKVRELRDKYNEQYRSRPLITPPR